MNESILISIIIPIYNRENCLNYCIDSVINQEYKNWELLIIDDGSTDRSSEICKAYSQEDSRIKYFYQQNKGAGAARNLGIEKSSGEWITFVDSDDAIMPEHLFQVIKNGKDCDLVMVNRCKAGLINGSLIHEADRICDVDNISLNGNKNIIDFLYGAFNPTINANFACWDKFFRLDIIKNYSIRFPVDVHVGEDQIFVVRYFMHTESFFYSKKGTYAPTPKGDEGINHLACQLRHPSESFYCQKENYNTLVDLYHLTNNLNVKKYAINYILSKPLERDIIPYSHWRNRRLLGKSEILKFIREEFKPYIVELSSYLANVQNHNYKKQLIMILEGKESRVYDYWYFHNLKNDAISAIVRRYKKIIKNFMTLLRA